MAPDRYIALKGPAGVMYHKIVSFQSGNPPQIAADKNGIPNPPWDADIIDIGINFGELPAA